MSSICSYFLHTAIAEPHRMVNRQNCLISDKELKGWAYFTLSWELEFEDKAANTFFYCLRTQMCVSGYCL